MSHRLSIFGVILIWMAVVYNPKEPVPLKGQPSNLILKEDLTIGKDTEDMNYIFSGLQHVQVDKEEYMYAADWKEALIKVYGADLLRRYSLIWE